MWDRDEPPCRQSRRSGPRRMPAELAAAIVANGRVRLHCSRGRRTPPRVAEGRRPLWLKDGSRPRDPATPTGGRQWDAAEELLTMVRPLPRFVIAKPTARAVRWAYLSNVPTLYRRSRLHPSKRAVGHHYVIACGDDGGAASCGAERAVPMMELERKGGTIEGGRLVRYGRRLAVLREVPQVEACRERRSDRHADRLESIMPLVRGVAQEG